MTRTVYSVSLITYFVIVAAVSMAVAQPEQAIDVFRPDPASAAEAKRIGGQVFKLLPYGQYTANHFNALKDEENSLGVRGGGAYYSFSTGSHSYNGIPQIQLANGRLSSGFSGNDYGLFADLGSGDLSSVETSSVETSSSHLLKFLANYRPPVFVSDIIQQRSRLDRMRVAEGQIDRTIETPVIGHTYLLRTISFFRADILVAFQVASIDRTGALTIIWKKIADFGEPRYLYMPDTDLQKKVDAITVENQLTNVVVTVKDNMAREGS